MHRITATIPATEPICGAPRAADWPPRPADGGPPRDGAEDGPEPLPPREDPPRDDRGGIMILGYRGKVNVVRKASLILRDVQSGP